MKILFVCNQGKYRSKTASELWKQKNPDDEVKYVGIFVEKNIKEKLAWADKIYLMEDFQLKKLLGIDDSLKIFNKTKVLNIEDIYKYNDVRLIKILKEKFKEFI